jgi:hypothetical protein
MIKNKIKKLTEYVKYVKKKIVNTHARDANIEHAGNLNKKN